MTLNAPLHRDVAKSGEGASTIGYRCLRVHPAVLFLLSFSFQTTCCCVSTSLCYSRRDHQQYQKWLPQEECWPLWSCACCVLPSPIRPRYQEPFKARSLNHSAKKFNMSPFAPAVLLASLSTQQQCCASPSEASDGHPAPPTTD